jgi:hypothetical protein
MPILKVNVVLNVGYYTKADPTRGLHPYFLHPEYISNYVDVLYYKLMFIISTAYYSLYLFFDIWGHSASSSLESSFAAGSSMNGLVEWKNSWTRILKYFTGIFGYLITPVSSNSSLDFGRVLIVLDNFGLYD